MKKDISVKKTMRKVNKVIRKLNKNIANDSLWKGRFVVRIIDRQRKRFEDNSGYWYRFTLQFIDKETGYYSLAWLNDLAFTFGGGAKIWWIMNDFIIKDINVWKKPQGKNNSSYIDKPIPKNLTPVERQNYLKK